MDNVLANEGLALHFGYYIFSVLEEYYNVINIRALAQILGILVLLQVCTHKALSPVDIQFLVCHNNLGGLNGLKVAYLAQPRIFCPVFLLQLPEVCYGIGNQILQIVPYTLHLLLKLGNLLIHHLNVKLGDLAYRLLHQFQDIVHYYRPVHKILELKHLPEHIIKLLLPCLGILLKYTVNLVLKENLLKREIVPLVLQLRHPYLKLPAQQLLGVICTVPENLVNPNKMRIPVYDHAGVWRN